MLGLLDFMRDILSVITSVLVLIFSLLGWLILLPFRIVGVAVHGVLEIIFLAITLPFRLLAAPFRI